MQPKRKTANEAVGRWPGILIALGLEPRFLQNTHGPCPKCGGKDRYRFDDNNGRGTWICSHCGSGDGFGLLRLVRGWDFRQAAKEVDRVVGTVSVGSVKQVRSDEDKLRLLRATWQDSRLVKKGDPVWRYLNDVRKLEIDVVPLALRFHPALKAGDGGKYPAMLALMRYPNGKGASIHRTYLSDDGSKAAISEPKTLMPGKPLSTAAVRLAPTMKCLGIAEGIETAFAASRRFGVSVWAATNASLLEAWVPPSGVEKVLIAGDNDTSWTGQAAAYTLARRLSRDGYTVAVKIPRETGKDWADERL